MLNHDISRRVVLAAGSLAFFAKPGLFAEELLLPTPRLTEGPFYPDRLSLDQDNDLIIIKDQNFQGFGTFETASDGENRFRTIKPVPYPGRPAPHIHIRVKQNGRAILMTQLMIR